MSPQATPIGATKQGVAQNEEGTKVRWAATTDSAVYWSIADLFHLVGIAVHPQNYVNNYTTNPKLFYGMNSLHRKRTNRLICLDREDVLRIAPYLSNSQPISVEAQFRQFLDQHEPTIKRFLGTEEEGEEDQPVQSDSNEPEVPNKIDSREMRSTSVNYAHGWSRRRLRVRITREGEVLWCLADLDGAIGCPLRSIFDPRVVSLRKGAVTIPTSRASGHTRVFASTSHVIARMQQVLEVGSPFSARIPDLMDFVRKTQERLSTRIGLLESFRTSEPKAAPVRTPKQRPPTSNYSTNLGAWLQTKLENAEREAKFFRVCLDVFVRPGQKITFTVKSLAERLAIDESHVESAAAGIGLYDNPDFVESTDPENVYTLAGALAIAAHLIKVGYRGSDWVVLQESESL